jgi:Secretion system C-terminal sorting domain/Beta-propeller repeat
MSPRFLLNKFFFTPVFLMLALAANAQNPSLKVFEDWHDTSGTQHFFQRTVVRTISGSSSFYVAGATLNAAGNYDMLLTKYNAAGGVLWNQQYNGAGNGDDFATDIQVDKYGDVFVTGSYYENSSDTTNLILIRYDSLGNQQWTSTYNGTNSYIDAGAAIYIDGTGSMIYVAGTSWAGTSRKFDMLVLQYDYSGNLQWDFLYDDSGWSDAAFKIAMNAGTGYIDAGGAVQTTATNVKYGIVSVDPSNGSLAGATSMGGNAFGWDNLSDLRSDKQGNIYITGKVLNVSTGYDIETIMLDSTLTAVWTANWSGSGFNDDNGSMLALDTIGNVFVTGYTKTASQGKDFVTIKYNASGVQQWVHTFNGTAGGNDSAAAMVISDTNQIYVTGYSFNGATNDYYTIKYDGAGNQIWEIGFNSNENGNDIASAIANDSAGVIYVAGQSRLNDSTMVFNTVKYVEIRTTLPQDTIAAGSSSFVFTENRGQLLGTDTLEHPEIKFYTLHGLPNAYFTDTAVSFVFAKLDTSSAHIDSLVRIDMKYKNPNANAKIRSMNTRSEYENFYLGHIPEGRCRVQNFDYLVSFDVWNNVDIIYGSNSMGMKYYFICKPGGGGGSYVNINLQYNGADSVKVDGNGQLIIYSRLGNIIQPKAAAWEIDGSGNFYGLSWQPSFVITNGNEVAFTNLGSYNSAHSLVIAIDRGYVPQGTLSTDNLFWSTFEGGTNDDEFQAVSASTGNWLFAGGFSKSTNFPFTTGGFQSTNLGIIDGVVQQFYIGIPNWSTYIGGASSDYIYSVSAIGSSNSVYLAGKTYSFNFPTAGLAGSYNSYSGGSSSDAIVARLNGGGGLVWSTCYGATTGNEIAWSVKAQSLTTPFYVCGQGLNDSALLTTEVGASNFTQGAAFVIKYDQTSFQRIWATRYGGTSTTASARSMDLTGDPSNFLVITGEVTGNGLPSATNSFGGGAYDSYVAAFDSSDMLNWSTYYGGNNSETSLGIAANSVGNIFICGITNGSNTPTPNPGGAYQITNYGGGTYDAFLASINSSGTIIWGTYLGGTGSDFGVDICIDQYDNVYLAAQTTSSNFPMPVSNPSGFYTNSYMNSQDVIIYEFDRYYGPIWGTYLGGHNWDEIQSVCLYEGALNSYLYTAGRTWSTYTSSINPFPIVRTSSGDFSNAYQHFLLNNSSNPNQFYFDGFVNAFDLATNPTSNSNLSNNFLGFNLYPNPSTGTVFLDFEIDKSESVNITVYNTFGQIIYQKNESDTQGKYHIELDLSFASNGLYVITVEFADQISTHKLVIEN